MDRQNHFGDMPEIPDMTDYDPEDRERQLIQKAIAAVCAYGVAFILGLMLCWLLSGCTTTRYVPVVEHHTDTLRTTVAKRDSIWLHDSIHIRDRGDTVVVERWHTKYIERTRTDTVYRAVRDSVPVPYEVIKEVPARLSKTQQGLQWLGLLALIGGILFAATKLRRFLP